MSDGLSIFCEFCGEPVNPLARETWHRVEGWERKGRAGGSDIALREKREGFAHPHCVSLRQSGLDVGQRSLV